VTIAICPFSAIFDSCAVGWRERDDRAIAFPAESEAFGHYADIAALCTP
jgi:hypothetical protein